MKISASGTYIVSGSLNGQLAVELDDSDTTQSVTLVLDNVNIKCTVAPGLIFYNGNEIDETEYEDSGTTISYSNANGLNFDNAGAKVIIADGSNNTVNGSHVAKCYKYTVNSDGSITVTTSKRAKYDGAFYSKISMSIKGETNGNGILNIIADNEGLDTEKHLLLEGGNVFISSQDDGINTNEEGGSVTLINGGTLTINSGLGDEGDGIDSNGYLIINGGTVISAAKPASDSGMDADLGVVINGGTIVGVGSSMDSASSTSTQPTMNLQFSSQISSSKKLIVKDSSGNTLITFSPESAGFIGDKRTYQGAILSHKSFTLNSVYYLYLDDDQLGYSGQGSSNTPGGTPPGGSGGTPPSFSGGTPPSFSGGNPPDGMGNNLRRQSEKDSKNDSDNKNNNKWQTLSADSLTKEFNLTSTVMTFSGVGIYSGTSTAATDTVTSTSSNNESTPSTQTTSNDDTTSNSGNNTSSTNNTIQSNDEDDTSDSIIRIHNFATFNKFSFGNLLKCLLILL